MADLGILWHNRFVALTAALVLLLSIYPYLEETQRGAFLGGLISLVVVSAGVFAVRGRRWVFGAALALGSLAALASARAMVWGNRGDSAVEAAFSLFYAFTTAVIFVEVVSSPELREDTIYGAVCVYLLIGVTFGTVFDLLESLHPGSFRFNVPMDPSVTMGWRRLIYFSFVTLMTVGYGDITPATTQAQSLALLEGVIGVLYVAVLIARIVGIYSRPRPE